MEFWKNQEFYIGKKLYSVKESSSNNGNWWGKGFTRQHSTKMLIKLSRLSFNKILRRKKCLFVLCLVAKRNWRTEVQFGSGNFYHEKSKPSHPKSFGLVFFFYLSKQKHHERIKKKNSIQNFIFLSFLLPSQCCQKPNGGLTFYSACRSGRGKGEKICTWKALGKCSFSWHDPYHVMKSWSTKGSWIWWFYLIKTWKNFSPRSWIMRIWESIRETFLGKISPVFQTNTYKSVLWTQLSSQPNPR